VNDLTLDQWRELRGKAYIAALLGSTWYAQPNDLIGGHCVMPVDQPPSSGHPEAADFCHELVAVHIAELHNAALAARGAAIDPGLVRWCGWPGCFSSYNAATGPTTPGWKRVNSPDLVLCGPHASRGHFPRSVLDVERFTVRPACSCGVQDEPRDATHGDLNRWWRTCWWQTHVEGLPDGR
jgi:hypothetical protein